ncbi:hypothetical protein PFICI_05014 [Pestalotiopsis fici W106-1]|uniref:Alpha-carbonic anhydrase domain-containing protein n=1 Tax=Pestalotiopsis fici (strain W106-1 / CGMCC3.15140) TaxID=1229662 RepID=W3XAL7_PESFW|nr:uncharacterized protein PFICI_05014 [Pestalotiopsis fici W106-1]ETS83138.1 hypothetical protein PFICI_05014 [Pestalotiopsis fici W106-1]
MTLLNFIIGLALTASVTACPSHTNNQAKTKRSESNVTTITAAEWAYDESYDWGMLSRDYELCQTGTQQSPIALTLATHGLSKKHRPTFNYGVNTTGNLHNWGYGPAFTLSPPSVADDYSSNPAMSYDNETVYLAGWHIHAPADHIVDGVRSHAELHFVHVDAAGHEKAVVGFRIDPAPSSSSSSSPSTSLNVDITDIVEDAFFAQLPSTYSRWDEMDLEEAAVLDLGDALEAVARLDAFYTYEGSLTSPPCHEGIRWFIAARVLEVSIPQMQAILAASTYSARTEQMIWEHHINE